MTKKRLIAILLVLVFCFSGCDNRPAVSTPSTDNNTTEPTVTTPSGESGNEDQIGSNDEFIYDVVRGEKDVWEKDKIELKSNSVSVNDEWYRYITVGENKIPATQLPDVSLLPNYYYGPNSSASDLEMVRYIPTLRYLQTTKEVKIANFASITLDATITTLVRDMVDHMERSSIFEEIEMRAKIHPYEGGIETLVENAIYDDGYFGLGSSHKTVIELLGEPTDFRDETDRDQTIRTSVYMSKHVELVVTYILCGGDNIDDAVVMEISWIPITACNYLHSQKDLPDFINYDKIYGPQT
jgi:hypothetical protein